MHLNRLECIIIIVIIINNDNNNNTNNLDYLYFITVYK